MAYLPEPTHAHGTPARAGVLLVNLGTPEAPTKSALRRYLGEFLWDPRIVEIPRPIWWLILNLFVLNLRPAKSAAKYASIWTKDGSPLRVHLDRQVQLLRGYLGERVKSPLAVAGACRYGNPSVAAGLAELRAKGWDRRRFHVRKAGRFDYDAGMCCSTDNESRRVREYLISSIRLARLYRHSGCRCS